MSLNPATFEDALARKLARPERPRKALKRSQLASRPSSPPGSVKASLQSRGASKQGIQRKVKAKKKKKVSVGNLKKKVWTQFSIFIRTRRADSEGWNTCVTCNVRKFWKDLQAGHFIRGRLNANLFSELGTWPQCYGCNVGKDGDVVNYYRWMLKEHGEKVINELLLQNSKTHKWGATELQDLLAHYKQINSANPLFQKVK